jgi:molybdopterin molybdotransferase
MSRTMIPFEEACQIVLQSARPTPVEQVPLSDCLNRVLAVDVHSDTDVPPHNLSTMDGFACRRTDLSSGAALRPVETIPAGIMPAHTCAPGECARIMTGAIVPEGCDTVVMLEHTEERNGLIHVLETHPCPNIRRRAEDLRAGDRVLTAGVILGPAHIAVLASVGCDPVTVRAVARVGIVATGDELIEAHEPPAPAKIRNSNSCQLSAQVRRAGCAPICFGITPDDPRALDDVLRRAAAQCDVVIFSGGVSMGDWDFVPEILKANGIRLLFEKIRIKPGRATVFGENGKTYFFGLPGNPVSTFIIFEVLVRPFLVRLMGGDYRPRRISARLAAPVTRRQADRPEFVPVNLTADGLVQPFAYHGSAHIHAYVCADAILQIPEATARIDQGAEVQIQLID